MKDNLLRRSDELSFLAPAVAAIVAVLTGALVANRSDIAVVVGFFTLAPLLLVSSHARLVVISFGALVTFQSSSDASTLKTVYFACFLLSVIGAFVSLSKDGALARGLPERRLAAAAGVILALALLSVVPALVYGTPLVDWSRDGFSYFLLGAAPLLAIDYARHVSGRTLTVVFVTSGAIATVSFFVSWIARRGTSELGISAFAFSSFLLPAALIAFAIARVLWPGARRLIWGAVASATFLALLATGTRSSLVAGVAVIVAVALVPTSLGSRVLGVTALAAIALGLGIFVLEGGVASTVVDVQSTSNRLATFRSAATDPHSDQGLQLRRIQTEAAVGLFKDAPVLGIGPGHPIKWSAPLGYRGDGYFVDSPAGFLAKFGILGLVALLAFVWLLGRFLYESRARTTPSGLALIAFLVTTGVWSVLGTPFDDKGTALALSLLLALTLGETGRRGIRPA